MESELNVVDDSPEQDMSLVAKRVCRVCLCVCV